MLFRLRAFSVHLAASLMVAVLALCLVFGVWYPSPLHELLDVTRILVMVLVVDVIIGPLLTLLVARAGKKSLKFDLAVIVCLQVAALLYGMHTVAEGRPAWIVFTGDRFELVQAYQLQTEYRQQAAPAFTGLPRLGPKWVGATLPESADARTELIFSALAGGPDLAQRPDYYQPYQAMTEQITASARPLSDLEQMNSQAVLADTLSRYPEADAYLPLTHTLGHMTVLLAADEARVIAIVSLVPW